MANGKTERSGIFQLNPTTEQNVNRIKKHNNTSLLIRALSTNLTNRNNITTADLALRCKKAEYDIISETVSAKIHIVTFLKARSIST